MRSAFSPAWRGSSSARPAVEGRPILAGGWLVRRGPLWATLACALTLPTAASAQTPKAYHDPNLVLNTGGHHAPVRGLVFSADGSQLYSASMDKTVHVWDLRRASPRLEQVIRPPIARGLRGAIYAVARTDNAPPPNRRLLAVAGMGVTSTAGEILLLEPSGPAGEWQVVGQLPRGDAADKEAQIHGNTVWRLAFSPDGRRLASGSIDGTARLWEVAGGSLAATFDCKSRVRALAFTPDGRGLITGSEDGIVRLWSTGDPTRPIASSGISPDRSNDRFGIGKTILDLVATPDGKSIFVGLENGVVRRLDLPSLATGKAFPPRDGRQGAVESLAMSHDGRSMVVCFLNDLGVTTEAPRPTCDVELRSVPGGEVIRRLATTSNLAYACAFSPDDDRVAVAGGDDQAIRLIKVSDPAAEPSQLSGRGSAIWEVGLDPTGTVVGFSRSRHDPRGGPVFEEGYDLAGRRFLPVDRSKKVAGGLTADGGWRLVPLDIKTIARVSPDGRTAGRFAPDMEDYGRWWSYSFVPGNADQGHPRRMVAVGYHNGSVILFDAETGKKTRVFAGHAGPIYTLATSADGRWLATGSADQTIKLWKLRGCDVLPTLGAKFRPRPDGTALVLEVEPLGFAEGAGLKVGDVVETFRVGVAPAQAAREFLARGDVDEIGPNVTVSFQVRGSSEPQGTTRRNNDSLTLFAGLDGQWVLWTPQGYYDTSAAGDRRYLGWLLNRGTMQGLKSSDYLPIDRYEKELRRPKVLDRLIETGDLGRAREALNPADPKDPAGYVANYEPPQVRVAQLRPAAQPGKDLEEIRVPLAISATPRRNGSIRSISVRVNNRLIHTSLEAFDRPQVVKIEREVPLEGFRVGPNRVCVTASDDQGHESPTYLDVTIGPEVRARSRASKLVVLSIGVDGFADASLGLPQASNDARRLAALFDGPGSIGGGFAKGDRTTRLVVNPEAGSRTVALAFEQLEGMKGRSELGQGDTVVVFLESHLLEFGSSGAVLGADSGLEPRSGGCVPAEAIASVLGGLAGEARCRVILLLDLLHPATPGDADRVKDEWVRDLSEGKGVIVFDASTTRLRVDPDAVAGNLGVFARALLEAPERRAKRNAPFTLEDFSRALAEGVARVDPDQKADGFWSDRIPRDLPLFEPEVVAP